MRILGIDLGSSSIKVVELDSSFGRFEVHDTHEILPEPEISPVETLVRWIQARPRTPDRLIAALNCSQFTFRNIPIPTRDKKTIQASILFGLEEELPFNIEDTAADWVILSQTKGSSLVHVAATLKEQVRNYLAPWSHFSIEPDLVTSEAWAYRAVLNRVLLPEDQEGPCLLVQIGHRRTTLYLHSHGQPIAIRDLDWGSEDLTLAISQKLGCTLAEAESIKINRAVIPAAHSPAEQSDLTPEQLAISEALKGALERLITEIKILHLTARNQGRKALQKIYLAGGGSLLQGLDRWVAEQSGIPTQKLATLSATATSGVSYSEQTDSKFALAAALAFCLVGQGKNTLINFRKGDFAKVSIVRKIDFKILKRPLIALGAVAMSAFLSLTIQSVVYQSRLEKLNTQLEKSVKLFFGQVSGSAIRGYVADPKKLRTAVNKDLNKQRELNRLYGPNPRSPALFLNQISSLIPKDLVVDLTRFQTGTQSSESYSKSDAPSSSTLVFAVSNPQVAERLATVLGRKLSSLKRTEMEEFLPPGSEVKKWKLSFTGIPTEDAYAK